MVALPLHAHKELNHASMSPHLNQLEAIPFSRLLLASHDNIRSILDENERDLCRAEEELISYSKGQKFSPYEVEKPFYDKCRSSIKEQRKNLKDKVDVIPSKGNSTCNNEAFYFYQAADGQAVFMHPLDTKILKYEYSSYDSFPPFMSASVIAFTESTIDAVIKHSNHRI